MSQCVPSRDMEDQYHYYPSPSLIRSNSTPHRDHLPMKGYEITELTWENGQLAMHGLAAPFRNDDNNNNNKNNPNYDYSNINIIPNSKPPLITIPAPTPPPPPPPPNNTINKYQAAAAAPTWSDKPPPPTAGTLESLVNHATRLDDLNVPWFHHHRSSSSATAAITMDALVPCSNSQDDMHNYTKQQQQQRGGRDHGEDSHHVSLSFQREQQQQQLSRGGGRAAAGTATTATTTPTANNGTTSTGTGGISRYNSSTSTLGGPGRTLTPDEDDSVSHSRPHREAGDREQQEKKKGSNKVKSSLSTRRSRAAAIHNQSERKRRDKINERMKTLQKLVPNSSKADKASMLDEVIEYLKQLQAQVQMMMSRMNMMMMMMQQTTPTAAALMLPMAKQQQRQMSSMMAPMMSVEGMIMGAGLGIGGLMGHVFDINSTINNGRSNVLAAPHQLIQYPNSGFVPSASMATNWDGPYSSAATIQLPDHHPFPAFFPNSQPMTMDAYSRMAAAIYQQALHQPPPSTSITRINKHV